MEHLTIGVSKIKLTLSSDEVVKYGLPSESRDSVIMRRALRRIIDASGLSEGFLGAGERLLIQTYKTDFGAEIFITKLGKLSSGAESALLRSKDVTLIKGGRELYRFYSCDAMLDFFSMPAPPNIFEGGELYLDDNGDYIISLSSNSLSDISYTDLLSEFADLLDDSYCLALTEHARLVCDSGYLNRMLSFKSI
ncbi:MAG: hypothetical protein J6Q69_01360 [Clostridia bacterium]|nr:hypothetical protein [Clostridia bacterium]